MIGVMAFSMMACSGPKKKNAGNSSPASKTESTQNKTGSQSGTSGIKPKSGTTKSGSKGTTAAAGKSGSESTTAASEKKDNKSAADAGKNGGGSTTAAAGNSSAAKKIPVKRRFSARKVQNRKIRTKPLPKRTKRKLKRVQSPKRA